MAQPKGFKESNLVIGAGNNPNTDQLPVLVSYNPEMSNGAPIPFIWGQWHFTEEELAMIAKNGYIWVSQMGIPIKPQIVTAYHPVTDLAFTPVPDELLQ